MTLARRSVRLLEGLMCLILASAASSHPDPADPRMGTDRQILVMVRLSADHFRPGAYTSGYADQLGQSARKHVAMRVAHRYGMTLLDNWPMPMIGVDCFVMMVPSGRSISSAAEQVSRDPEVSWAQPVALYSARAAEQHNDSLYPVQPAAVEWHLGDLHRIATGRGVRVAVVDSGIDVNHPDLSGQVIVNRNFVSGQSFIAEEHGTAVAGIIAAKADNGVGIAGVAPGARLLGLRACWQQASRAGTVCDTLSLAKALYYAVEAHAEVINLSLSGPGDRLLHEIIASALDKRLAVVAAVDPQLAGGGFPASMPGVIRVTDSMLAVRRPDVYMAPGRNVPTTEPGGRWFLVNGSSFAAAHVSGLVALVRQHQPKAPITLVSAQRTGGPIDACGTLMHVVRSCDCACATRKFEAGARD